MLGANIGEKTIVSTTHSVNIFHNIIFHKTLEVNDKDP